MPSKHNHTHGPLGDDAASGSAEVEAIRERGVVEAAERYRESEDDIERVIRQIETVIRLNRGKIGAIAFVAIARAETVFVTPDGDTTHGIRTTDSLNMDYDTLLSEQFDILRTMMAQNHGSLASRVSLHSRYGGARDGIAGLLASMGGGLSPFGTSDGEDDE